MVTLTTATEAVNHWAPEAARIDHTLHNLDDLLPQTTEGQTPIAEETRQDVEDALMRARLGMDTVLGVYSWVLFHEQTVIQRYQPHLDLPPRQRPAPAAGLVAPSSANAVNDVQAKGSNR
jgi:hypothetical protein